MSERTYSMGIDIGSITAKVVIIDSNANIQYSAYRRHKAETGKTLLSILDDVHQSLGEIQFSLLITGSAGMGVTEKYELPFIQEVVASAEVVKQLYPEVKTLIDIGGEDAKIIFFDDHGYPDIRMNGSCAGGTGAFIDEMATLLDVSLIELNDLAEQHTTIHPIASRCGVFAKTDVQNLLSREIVHEDIAASVFHALVFQTLATLARGHDLNPSFMFSGGPLTFLPALKQAFIEVLQLSPDQIVDAEHSELLPAIGAAISDHSNKRILGLNEFITLLSDSNRKEKYETKRLEPLFSDLDDLNEWQVSRSRQKTPRVEINQIYGEPCFLGVDAGSTTGKIVLIDNSDRLVFDFYANNNGKPIQTIQMGLSKLRDLFSQVDKPPIIAKSVVTGYGEDLIRSAFGFDEGMVETLAHFRGAKAFNNEVTFILDIGGQDMKAIFVHDGNIQNIEINEACSSGCGYFIESFARSMDYQVSEFAKLACTSKNPCDLGSRCTVFMNSKVKQALREGAKVTDISAGLAYSVIRNTLHKVLKITNTDILGSQIVVQGGTFRNQAVHKALEKLIGKEIICPDIAELMGAYGAALTARENFHNNGSKPSTFVGLDNLETVSDYQKRIIRCRGCENRCTVTKLIFPNQNKFYTGNRCERIYTNKGDKKAKGTSLPKYKYEILFDRSTDPVSESRMTIGIPRALNMYELFPFWNSLLTECGFSIKLSKPSSVALYEKGAGTVMSENICFPAKLTHGHIFDLIEAGVDRIFFPMVFYEKKEFIDSTNSYNCPIVTGYPDVVLSSIDPEVKHGIPLDRPVFTFHDIGLLKKSCFKYLSGLGISRSTMKKAFKTALEVQREYKDKVQQFGLEILRRAKDEDRKVILLIGRPYHIDSYINHKIPDIITDFGVDVITEDAVPMEKKPTIGEQHILTQWQYVNRQLYAAQWASKHDEIEVVQLNSFACAPDAIIIDENKSILGSRGKGLTIIRIDQIESTGSAKLRLRSVIERMNDKYRNKDRRLIPRKKVKVFNKTEQHRKILVVNFSHFIAPVVEGTIKALGYKVETLPPSDRGSVDLGLKYSNNEVCYPGIILIGDIIRALQSGKYDLSEVAVGTFITGGQCRASCYTPLFKRALIAAGFKDVPIVAITNDKKLHKQPGFDLNLRKAAKKGIMSIIYCDAIRDMYYATASRELHKGEALALADRYLKILSDGNLILERSYILNKLEEIVSNFNQIETIDHDLPKVGIVGEIYVKYNNFSNHFVAEWLINQGFEVFVPNLLEFFLGWFVSASIQLKSNTTRHNFNWLLTKIYEPSVQSFLNDAAEVMHNFRYSRPHHSIHEIAKKANKVLSLTHQYGEGWLLSGEIGTLVEDGVKNVLCLQPFGCISNQVVARGVSKRMFEQFQDLNLLFLDLDAGVSEVNYFNRMHFFINRAREGFQQDKKLRLAV